MKCIESNMYRALGRTLCIATSEHQTLKIVEPRARSVMLSKDV